MSGIKTLLLAMVAVCALNVAATAAASAHEFNNKGAQSKLVGTADQVLVLTTAEGKIECTKLIVTSGNAPAGKTTSLLVAIQYSGCKFFGLAGTFSEAVYLFNANGEVVIKKPLTIKATSCEIIFPDQTVKANEYENLTTKAIKITPEIRGITSEGFGGACTYAKESKGTLTGASLLSLENGAEIEYTSP